MNYGTTSYRHSLVELSINKQESWLFLYGKSFRAEHTRNIENYSSFSLCSTRCHARGKNLKFLIKEMWKTQAQLQLPWQPAAVRLWQLQVNVGMGLQGPT